MSDQKELRKMLKDLLNLESGLSDWEIEFIDSLNNWVNDFTPKQINKIEALWGKHF